MHLYTCDVDDIGSLCEIDDGSMDWPYVSSIGKDDTMDGQSTEQYSNFHNLFIRMNIIFF